MELNNLQYGQNNEILRFIISNGMINLSDVQNSMEAMKRKELLDKHPYKIWEGKDGKWYTYLPDEKKGRVQRERTSQIEIENLVINYWKTQMENPTINEIFKEWNDRRLELKKISNATHLRNQQIFDRHYKEFGTKKIKSVEMEELEEFLENQIAEKNLTAKAFSDLKTVTRGLLKRAKKRKLITINVDELFQELDTSETDFIFLVPNSL